MSLCMYYFSQNEVISMRKLFLMFAIFGIILSALMFSFSNSTETIKATTKTTHKITKSNNTKNNSACNNVKKVQVSTRTQSVFEKRLFELLNNEKNRTYIASIAKKLHNGTLRNSCVYFASEALRKTGVSIPASTATTDDLTLKLQSKGFKKSTDLSNLLPGDICFTTLEIDKVRPAHTYIFMGWEKSGKHDYAYVCDNQVLEYGKLFHLRNINFSTDKTNAISYFMYK